MQAAGLRTARNTIATDLAGRARRARRLRAAADRPPGVHARRPRRRHRPHRGGVRADRRARAGGVADRPGADRRVGARLGRVRARGDARRRGQRRDRLLDRERRPDGRPHRRQRHRRAAADAHRPPVPAAARPGDRGDPRGRGGDRRLQRPVRGQPRDRGDRRDRDEPARVALVGAGLEGDGLPDRQDRRAARGRLPARRDPQRHHAPHAGELRADDRLRGRQVAAVRVREVPRRRRGPLDAHEVGRRGDGDRAHVPAGVREGDALARARHRASPTRRRPARARWRSPAPTASTCCSRRSARGATRGRGPRAHGDRPVVPARAAGAGAAIPRRRSRASAPSRRSTPAPPSSPPRRRTTTRPGSAGRRRRGPPRRQAERDDPRLRPEPDRPGDRVRLLLRARGDDRARVRPRRGDGQLQPGDGVDRLRHLRPAVLRAADARGRARRSSRSSSPRA